MSVTNLLLPALRWSDARGFDGERDTIERGLELGVGGFILFGGEQDAVRQLTKELRLRSRVPLLIAADLERGAGQQFAGATGLPPLAAIASLGDVDAVRRAARLTAREARTLGVNWDYAPVCDLDLEPDNPILGTRALGSDPTRVASLAAAWIGACQGEGVLACAKHFPGHGRTRTDSHAELPVVDVSRRELMDADLVPFRSAIEAGVASIMTAHVAYPGLDASGAPATLSREILQWLLRQQMRFDGLIVTDALIMEGALTGRSEADAAIFALEAGCDVLLYPKDVEAVARALERALESHRLDPERVNQSVRRRLKWAQWASPPNEYRRPASTDVQWGAQLADRVIAVVRGGPRALRSPVDIVIVDDDIGGPFAPPSREPLLDALRAAGLDVRRIEPSARAGAGDVPRELARGAGARASAAAPASDVIIALFGETRAWKGRIGYGAQACAAVARALAAAPDAILVQFGHPRLASTIPAARTIVSAWGGEAAMQQAAARWLLRQR